MAHSERMGQTIGMGIDRFVHGVIERIAEKALPRLRLDANEGSPMAFLKCRPVLRLVQTFGLRRDSF